MKINQKFIAKNLLGPQRNINITVSRCSIELELCKSHNLDLKKFKLSYLESEKSLKKKIFCVTRICFGLPIAKFWDRWAKKL